MNALATKQYKLINPEIYRPLAEQLIPKLEDLEPNWVTYKNEIHKKSRFAICQYSIHSKDKAYFLNFDPHKSAIASNQKKTYSNPDVLKDEAIQEILRCFLHDIQDNTLTRAEVKLIQTSCFPFIFNPHRDSQFRRLKQIRYLATVIVSADGIVGGNMQLFHSDEDKIGPFHLLEELPLAAGVGYIINEKQKLIFHGMKPAYQQHSSAHRAALLIRFF